MFEISEILYFGSESLGGVFAGRQGMLITANSLSYSDLDVHWCR